MFVAVGFCVDETVDGGCSLVLLPMCLVVGDGVGGVGCVVSVWWLIGGCVVIVFLLRMVWL